MILLLYFATVLLTHAFAVTANESCSTYNGSYCGGHFRSGVRVAMPDGHDALISEHLMNLNITGYETLISEACYNNVVAALCYSTLNVCQNDSNETLPICYNNCIDFNSVIDNECPYYVKSGFSQIISDANLCGNVNSPLDCNEIIPEIIPITNSSGVSHVHASCVPFQGPVECIPYMNYSYYYSYTSDYESERREVIDLISTGNCNTSRAIQYICNSIFPVCEVNSGEPVMICEDDCLAVTSQSSCEIFIEASSSFPVNCSNSLQYIEENYDNVSSHSSNQCITLPATDNSGNQPQCVEIPVENCKIVLRRNLTYPQDFSANAGSVFVQSALPNTSSKCMISLTYTSCFFSFVPCDPNGALPLRICPEDCIVPDAISLYACREVYDIIRASNTSTGEVIRDFDCLDPSTYLDTDYSPNECLPIITLRELFAEEIKEYEEILNGGSSDDDDDDDDDNLLFIVIGVIVGVTVIVVIVIMIILTLYCVRKHHHSKSGKHTITYDKKNGIVEVPDAKFGSTEKTEKQLSPESDHGEQYINPVDSISTKESIHSRHKIEHHSAVTDDYYNCHDSEQQNAMREPSLYLPSSEATNMDDSVLITREDLYRLSDGKIMSALLPKNSLVIDTILGEGAFGKVYKGYLNQSLVRRLSISVHSQKALTRQRGDSVLTVAIKTIKSGLDKEECLALIKESAIMKTFDHPNVLGLVGISLNTEDGTPMIAIPFMKYGDLKTFLVAKRKQTKAKNTFPEGMSYYLVIKMGLDVAKGMEYLANRKFVHRDLAARNCMLDDQFSVKIADFGLTRDVYSRDYYKVTTNHKLPVKWMALESLNDKISNVKTDVWSFGVTFWEIFSLGRQPYPGVHNMEVVTLLEHGKRLTKPPLCDEAMYKIMHDCWLDDPDDRPNFSELVTSISSIADAIQPQIKQESIETLKRNYNPEAAKNVFDFSTSLSESLEAV